MKRMFLLTIISLSVFTTQCVLSRSDSDNREDVSDLLDLSGLNQLREAEYLQDHQFAPEFAKLYNLRRAIAKLQPLLQASSSRDTNTLDKRSCRVRLGGHCITQELDKVMETYDYLKSSKSPGRRRRAVHKLTNRR